MNEPESQPGADPHAVHRDTVDRLLRAANAAGAAIANLNDVRDELLLVDDDPDPYARPHIERAMATARHEAEGIYYAIGNWVLALHGPRLR